MRQAAKKKAERFLFLQLILAALLFSLPSFSLIADTFSDHRALVGLKLFRTLVGADLKAHTKLDEQGRLPISLLYVSDDRDAKEYLQSLSQTFLKVGDIPVHVDLLALDDLASLKNRTAAIYVSQPLNTDELKRLVDYSVQHHIIVFSPFEGDVERGVLAGLSVEATVRPLINLNTLQDSQLSIKSFYLKVAKHYE